MSEPPEQEDEEPAADADLEELLEQFREPEEPPRQRANPLWVVAGVLLTVLAGWLALRASGGGVEDKPESAALAGAMLPGKTSERLPREEGSVDLVEDYLARCKKGMTAQEVRWIVEDFQKAGLSAPSEGERIEKFVAVRLAQHRWYLDLLDDGLGLDAEQRRVAAEKLWLLADEATQKIAKELMEHDASVGKLLEKQPEILEDLIDAEQWIEDERYAPWNLVDLSEGQLSLTRYNKLRVANRPDSSEWLVLLPEEMALGDAPNLRLSRMAMVLPPTSEQKLPQFGEDMLEEAKLLHPAQLRLLLLFAPGGHQWLLKALEKAGE